MAPVSTGYRLLIDAARLYAASDSSNGKETIARRHVLKGELHAFARVLDKAEPDDGAAFLGSLDATRVPNPLAGAP